MSESSHPITPNIAASSEPTLGEVMSVLSRYTQAKLKGERKNVVTPSFLCLTLILSFLPWLNVTCNGRSIAKQSGLQTAYGGKTLPPKVEDMMKIQEKMEKMQKGESKKDEFEVGAAWMMWLVLLAVLGGIVLGFLTFASIPALKNPLFAHICAGVAFLLLTLQMLVGFPIENSIEKKMAEKRAEKLAANKGKPDFEDFTEMMFEVEARYTSWFWLAYLTTAVPLAVFGVDWYTRRQQSAASDPQALAPPPTEPDDRFQAGRTL